MRLIKDFNLAIEAQSFEEICVIVLSCKEKNAGALLEKVALMKALGKIKEYTNQCP